MKREYHTWFSPILNKQMELLMFGHSGAAVIFFPTRTARFYDYENWRIIDAIKDKIEQGLIQVFCVDSADLESFYSTLHPADKIKKHLDYETYILTEVIPFAAKQGSSPFIIAAGCSLGGYHAVNIAFKHPQIFKKVVGMSARYDLTTSSDAFPDLLNGFVDENIYFNMPTMYMPNLTDKTILDKIRALDITLVSGGADPFFPNNKALSDCLLQKNILANFYVWEGESHRPRYWREMVKLYL